MSKQEEPSIFTQRREEKTGTLGHTDRLQSWDETRSSKSTSLSSGETADASNAALEPPATHPEPANALLAGLAHASPAPKQVQAEPEAAWTSRDRKANQAPPGSGSKPRHHGDQGRRANGRPLTPYFFLVAGLLFFISLLLFFRQLNNNSTPSILRTTKETVSIPEPEIKMATEQTFIAIKPDGVQRGLVGPIISRFENRGYKLVALKLVSPSKEHLETHYADLKEKPFFPGLVQYMLSGPIAAMVWEGRDAVKTGRVLLGATNPLASAPGTIRGDFAIDVGRNVCHGSDSVENAKKEIALWFKEGEVINYQSHSASWIYEKA
ncbi:hypothetical protein PFICI_09622 [Pestalotiopsis fici W106-1]|uniref:Nucleoside diphosphate kinase n=1 Tax=Pestalotiopsis fici (strain W106-1 / CGMCC3.15140) TaxID=1229662 RepID=W3X192_PESFW|nr:uncharacterized protein PFICI_09622 [Pestalotiopsis fici W106-1]ETS79769.1 hypothetical protein PFICI_09622 [Pestalotiopsis fici W106-1]